jgi:hypothetical protein
VRPRKGQWVAPIVELIEFIDVQYVCIVQMHCERIDRKVGVWHRIQL